ncbi:MAG TPA: NAD(P)-dependent oxidoreductase [Thermoleophilaceae bacterium]|nr:NAD(P)-dependent oxidoreductase [Thermoleophilaceae bacterium]
MRVFLAGGSGVVGERLVPALAQAGHTVVALTRSPGKIEAVRALGAEPAVADALDREALEAAVREAQPEAVIHQLTAIPDRLNVRKIARDFEFTNRLRTEGTDNLLEAARAAGARRFVAQSFAGWPYARVGGPVKDEDDPLDSDSPGQMRPILDAIRHLESAVTGAADLEGIVLRYGPFYGPGTSMAADGAIVEEIRKRRFPIVGSGGGVWSFVHVDDVASATVAALERGRPGIYNIVDDEPATVSEWLPVVAEAAGAKPPRRVPAWVGRLASGPHGVAMMTDIRGASNAKAKRELGWQPAHSSWREGFRVELGGAS